MRLKIENIKENPVNLLRRAGYTFQRNEQDEMSFIRPMARSGYPRFHMYAHVEGLSLLINFHLDQKKETYGQGTRHHGEYEEEGALQAEAIRIRQILG
ncbi:MAG: hypothetical protein ACD_8C00118G0004 [uncultured bacterium]|nr:MAG: hypothetical protein ACD_8C00118G0004 [uncultured bacterium]